VEQKNYQIRIEGHLDDHWAEWLGGMIFAQFPDGTTTLTGQVVDQAALYGLLKKLDDMGLSLISVNEVKKRARSDPFQRST
jgi:hypothetical protein